MRRLLLFVLFAMALGRLRANEIDRLRTKRDVERFVEKVYPQLKKEALFTASPQGSGKLDNRGLDNRGLDPGELDNRYFKLDMDGNGLTDLVVNGQYTMVVLDQGGHYTVFNIGRPGNSNEMYQRLLAIDSAGQLKKLVVRQLKGTYWSNVRRPQYYNDTLVIHFGQLMEYNAHPDTGFRFDGIRVLTTRCKGPCPLFEMLIRPGRWTRYDALENNKQKGRFACFMPAPAYDTLMEILRYMPLDRMDTAFLVNRTDDQTVLLDIFYNGRARQIGDYGKMGTYGLQRLYALFFRWRDTLEWKENQ